MSLAGAAIVSAETILALTPIAIKKTPLDPISAIWSRTLSSAGLGYWLTSERSLPASEWAPASALGYTNLLHIASSYESFRHLPAGQAMSILYTYPLWNLVLGSVFRGEEISARSYGLMAAAAGGSVLLNMDPGIAAPSALGREVQPVWGVFMALIMALTESGMFTILKELDWKDAAKSVWVVNGSASAWLGLVTAAGILFNGSHSVIQGHGSWWDTVVLTAFHAFSLFSGYWLRFYAIPRLSTVTYSILSYAGLLASYIFGILFVRETPGWMSVLGAVIIMVSGFYLQSSDEVKNKKKD